MNFQELLCNILEESTNAVFVIEEETYQILYVNQATQKLALSDFKEAEHKKCYEYMRHQNSPCEDCPMQRVQGNLETEYQVKNFSDDRYLNIRVKRMQWNGRKLVITHVEDATELRHARAVQPEADMVSQLADLTDTSIYVADFETDELLYLNRAGQKVLGVDAEKAKGHKCYEFLMHREQNCQFCHKAMFEEEQFREKMITYPFDEREYRIRSKIVNWNGRKAHIHYITDETNFYKEQSEIRDLTDHIPAGIGIYYVYPDGSLEPAYLNDGYYKMIGSTRREREKYQGFTVLNALNPEDADLLRKNVADAIQKGTQVNQEIRVLREDGSYIWLGIRAEIVEQNEQRATLYCAYSDIDKLKRTQQALEESGNLLKEAYQKVKGSEESMQAMLEHFPGAMVIFEVRSGMLWLKYISEGCKSISGFSAKETYVRHAKDPLADAHPESQKFFREQEAKDIQSGEKLSYKYRIVCKDGSYKWVALNLSPVKIPGSVYYYGVLRDIDAVEMEHIEKENKFQQMIENMNSADDENLIAKGRYDLTDNKLLYYQRKAQNSLELHGDITYDMALQEMVRTAATTDQGEQLDRKMNREVLLHLYEKGEHSETIEYQRRDKNGVFWSLLKYYLYPSPENGNLIYFVYTYDITERILEKQMMSKLGAIEYDVLGLIDVKTHQFESKNIRGVKSLADSGNAYIKGYFEDVVGRQVAATVPEAEREELSGQLKLARVMEVLNKKETYSVAFSAYKSDHSYRRKKMNFSYLDESHTTIFYYCNDITEPYDREQEQLHRIEDALEAARAANESKTEFFSRMSHDMRTPMNGILGMAELSQEEKDPEVLKDNIKKIKESGEYLLGLINDTLDFQRIESGKLKLEPEIVNCEEIMHNVEDMLGPSLKKKRMNFQIHRQDVDTNCYLWVDPVRLKQIFINLFSNAIKFTPEGGTISVEVSCLRREGLISQDQFIIRDTGIGMSEDFVKNKIFKPFSQEHNTVTGQYAGSGLGLSIVKKLIELMGGQISVESQQGVGTAFTIAIDFERVTQEDVAKYIASREQRKRKMNRCLAGVHILLAEDHPLNAEIARKLLAKAECEVTWAKDGLECVEVFKNAKEWVYDMILMDVRMPQMNGLEATRVIRGLPRKDAAKIPIIAMTANAYEEDIKNCLGAGMNAHLAKPIDPEKLYETMTQYLQKEKNI